MSDSPTKAMIRGWNNDGMDPDWIPPEGRPLISDPVEKIKKLINICEELSMAFDNVEVRNNLQDDEFSTRVTRENKFWRDFLSILDDVKFK